MEINVTTLVRPALHIEPLLKSGNWEPGRTTWSAFEFVSEFSPWEICRRYEKLVISYGSPHILEKWELYNANVLLSPNCGPRTKNVYVATFEKVSRIP